MHDISTNPELSKLMKRIIKGDTAGEITTQANTVYASLARPPYISQKKLQEINDAHIYLWVTHSYQDHVFDNNETSKIDEARNFVHSSKEQFSTVMGARTLIDLYYRQVERALKWEMGNLRATIVDGRSISIPKLPSLNDARQHMYNGAAAHILPTALVLSRSKIKKEQVDAIFGPYVTARQLADDLHDWREDFSAGRLNYVILWLLHRLNIQQGTYTLDSLIEEMKREFFYYGASSLSYEAISLCDSSISAISKSSLFIDQPLFINKIIIPLKEKIALPLERHMAAIDRIQSALDSPEHEN